MPLVNAKCTNCGANLQVDNTKDAAICQYCGSAYIVEKAINNYNTVNNIHANVVNIYGGNSADFVIRAGVLEKYNGASTHAIIPNSVHRIGGKAFANCYGLKQVTIPNTVTYIDGWAFIGCISLEKVVIPHGVTFIGARAFEGCENLVSVSIPNTVEEISFHAFAKCKRLKSIVIPDSVTKLRSDALSECTSLQSVILSKNLPIIEERTFAKCSNLESIIIPKGTKLKDPGGYGCDVYDGAFYECTKLTNVIFEGGQTQIVENAFHKTPWLEKKKTEFASIQKQNWRRAGVCDSCGGNFTGLITKKCSRCGRNKQY